MSEFTLQMNKEIKNIFNSYKLSEDDVEFYNYMFFDDLKENDFILFPFNLRSGIYKIKKTMLGPIAPSDKKLYSSTYRNCSGSFLIPNINNHGIWVMKINPKYVDWDFWEDVESMVSFNYFDLSINIDKVHGYSNWYEFDNWRKQIKPEIFSSNEIKKILLN